MSSIQVIVYDIWRGPILEAKSYYYVRNDSEQPPVSETNVHFLAKFTPVKLNVPIRLRLYPDNQPPVVETNVHFIAKFKPAQQFSFYKFNLIDNESIEPPFIETNRHFIASFTPVVYKRFAFNAFENDLSSGHIASTQDIPLPVNCVLIGQQVYEPGRSVFSKNLLRSIFRE